jgi:hypothetical protein
VGVGRREVAGWRRFVGILVVLVWWWLVRDVGFEVGVEESWAGRSSTRFSIN